MIWAIIVTTLAVIAICIAYILVHNGITHIVQLKHAIKNFKAKTLNCSRKSTN